MMKEKNDIALTKEVIARGRADLGWFIVNILDVPPEHFWDKMQEMCDSVRDNDRTSVGAGHGVSKTFTLGRIALAFLYCFAPATVVTTAPTGKQVKDLLWREIREAHASAKVNLGGKLTTLGLDLQEETGVKWFATGFSTKPDTVTKEATAFQGYHNENLLVLFDEAAGILPEIWRAAKYIGAPFKRFIAVGNPTSASGEFANSLKDKTYNHINISVTDTPNFKQKKTVIPGVYGRDFEREVRTASGIDSDEYRVRVLGLISRKRAQGAYYADVTEWLRKKDRFTNVPHNRHKVVYVILDTGYTTAIWFLQPAGLENHLIRYHEDSGVGIDGYAKLLREMSRDEGYEYAKIIVPCDMDSNATRVVTGDTTCETLKDLGFIVEILPKEIRVQEGIERTEKFLYSCRFDEELCKRGIDCLENYHEKKNKALSTDEKMVFTGRPEKDGHDHGADGMRYVSKAAKMGMFKGNEGEILSKWQQTKARHTFA